MDIELHEKIVKCNNSIARLSALKAMKITLDENKTITDEEKNNLAKDFLNNINKIFIEQIYEKTE